MSEFMVISCGKCQGTGYDRYGDTCNVCGGSGHVKRNFPSEYVLVTCGKCNGSGYDRYGDTCSTCNGVGRVSI